MPAIGVPSQFGHVSGAGMLPEGLKIGSMQGLTLENRRDLMDTH